MAKSKRRMTKNTTSIKPTVASSSVVSEKATQELDATSNITTLTPSIPDRAPIVAIPESKYVTPVCADETFIVQYQGNEICSKTISARIKEDYANQGNDVNGITSLNAYIKPEENKVYYVINDNFQGFIEY